MILDELPKISCILLSPTEEGIQRFVQQCYPNKELVLCVKEELAKIPDEAVYLRVGSWLSLGEWKDAAIEVSTGRLICWWENCQDLLDEYCRWKIKKDSQIIDREDFNSKGNMMYARQI